MCGRALRLGLLCAVFLTATWGGVGLATASNVAVGLSEQSGEVTVPTWLYLATGGGVIGAASLMTMLVTDRRTIDAFHEDAIPLSLSNVTLTRAGSLIAGGLGLLALVAIIIVGVVGPQQTGNVSLAVLLIFVGGRAVLTVVAYAVGNPWPALNPWRQIAEALPTGYYEYPDWLASWPAVGALVALIWLEIVAPLSSSPRVLALVVVAYSVFTVAGAVAFTPGIWFERGDPISVWFRLYGAVAPIQRTDDGLEFRYPGAKLGDADVIRDTSGIAFILILVWELTFSGLIVTAPGITLIEFLVGVGLPAPLVYLLILVSGLWLCWRVYWYAAARTRRRSQTYLSTEYLALRYAPPLLAIAAGYHVAHYVGFSISLWPSLLETLVAPLDPPANPTQYALPSWFGYVEIAGILIGHILAVWIAHAVSFELFPGKLQAIRSQYPFIIVMIVFTMVSLYLVSLPAFEPPYVPE